jgi:hypothetical protein
MNAAELSRRLLLPLELVTEEAIADAGAGDEATFVATKFKT